jgi:mRNA-degrading endonuclease RelE of RelBE toxin-antitoxin system
MKIVYTKEFIRDYRKLPDKIQKLFDKQISLLLLDSKHPSLHIKKTKGNLLKNYQNIFEGRIDRGYRFLFLIETGEFIFLRCGSHGEFFK